MQISILIAAFLLLGAAYGITALILDPGSRFVKGARIGKKKTYMTLVRKLQKGGMPLMLNDIPVLQGEENKGFFFIGKPGVGKTLSFYNTISSLNTRQGCKKIIYDFKGDYTAKFYDADIDLILNPFDARSIKWNIFNEIAGGETLQEIMSERIASSIIPDCPARHGYSDKFWRDGAREILVAILNYLRLENIRDNRAVYNMLSLSPAELSSKLGAFEATSNALNFINPPDSPQAGGIMATLTQFTKFFKYIAGDSGGSFSIPGWMNNGRGGSIFVAGNANLQDILRPLLTLFIDLVSSNILALPDNTEKRLYLLIDELGTLHPLGSLVNLLTCGRSKGASIWLAVQDFSQIDNIYGENLRKTILNSCTTHVYFSVADNFTAETISRLIGEQEVIEESKTAGWSSSPSVTSFRKKKLALMPSEIIQLKPFNFIFRGNIHPPFFSSLDPEDFKKFPDKNEPFIIK